MPRQTIYTNDPDEDLSMIYEWGHTEEGLNTVNSFHKNQEALNIVTSSDFIDAKKKIGAIAERIRGKRVVEIGAGVGFLAVEMAKHAKTIVAIESDPAFSWIFAKHLYSQKPDNLTWIFGNAQNFRDSYIAAEQAEVAVIFTRSGIDQMKSIGEKFADEVIMYYQEYEE